jgi:predicted YcjX-like family ATPase
VYRSGKRGHALVISTITNGVRDLADGVRDATESVIGTPSIRIGVTGLARAGKTVFITSLIANLLDRGRMPGLIAAGEGRIESAFLQRQPDDTVPRFDYEGHLGALTAPSPVWPENTRSISELRLSLRVRPKGLLSGWQSPRIVHLDIVDYPGEWLLDLGLLDKSFANWSADVLARIAQRPQAKDYLAQLRSIDPSAPLDEPQAKTLASAFTAYLTGARMAGFYDCTPGRFLLPGDLAGSPVLTFAPLPPSESPRRSLARELERRFEVYKARVVKPFFRDHFARIDRQVVLVDLLGAIHSGPPALEDLRAAMADILSTFRPGKNAFLSKIFFGRQVEKILFAATKADHIHHSQHGALTGLVQALTRQARDRAQFAGAQTEAMAIAALRATTEEMIEHNGAELGVVRGTLLDTGRQAAFYPGALPDDPSHLLTPARSGAKDWLDEDYEVMKFAPARLTLKPGDGPPHLRLDHAAQFLIGDRL